MKTNSNYVSSFTSVEKKIFEEVLKNKDTLDQKIYNYKRELVLKNIVDLQITTELTDYSTNNIDSIINEILIQLI